MFCIYRMKNPHKRFHDMEKHLGGEWEKIRIQYCVISSIQKYVNILSHLFACLNRKD